jgi:Zn-dependent peptidase ImmA (M78 family)
VYCRADDIGVDPESKALEREANVFAANLLMPEPAVRAEWPAVENLDECAARFDVSPSAMHWRLYSFGMSGQPDAGASRT